ncbi:MAG: hypothetical protein OXT67_03855 [Zetaproteobacteria bacterium]|nr:hypothetical protein [Zetaproteobacteria bacterium]
MYFSLCPYAYGTHRLVWVFVLWLWVEIACGGDLMLKLGPPGVGNGGPNPLSIPPASLLDYEVSYLSSSDVEYSLSVVPGILVGVRHSNDSGVFAGVGGGLVISGLGSGLGGYYSVGYRSSTRPYAFEIDLKQAFGLGSGQLLTVYALRMGLAWSL